MKKEKKSLRVLHLASFTGNIGDLVNHFGARQMLAKKLSFILEFTELEIREFYWKKRNFDEDFVDYANSFDLLIIGGGNYFELWVDHSATGTSIDITPECLARLKVPTVFFALGVDIGQGYKTRSVQRFASFMNTVLERRDMFVCIRNDGSRRALCTLLGKNIATSIPTMPDGGFFVCSEGCHKPQNEGNYRIGINIAGDMLERRFDHRLSTEGFLSELASVCHELTDMYSNLYIDLMPHIWRDNVLIAEMLPLISDPYLRRYISIGHLEPNKNGLSRFIKNYCRFDLVLGMRFHANVCPIGMGIPTRGLFNYPQIRYLYEELGLPDRLIDVRKPGFGKNLSEAVLGDLADLPVQRDIFIESMDHLNSQAKDTLELLDSWLFLNF